MIYCVPHYHSTRMRNEFLRVKSVGGTGGDVGGTRKTRLKSYSRRVDGFLNNSADKGA